MPTLPSDVINEALSELGVDDIAALDEGSRAADAGLRIYDTVLRSMHAVAPWNFARRARQIDLRADRAGEFSNNIYVPVPWRFAYEWPPDCVAARYVPALNASALDESGAPVFTAAGWNTPAPFLVADLPLVNDVASDWDQIEGHTPGSTRCILTDQLGAHLVYTGIVQEPDAWPPLFRASVVAELAARLAMSAVADKGVARALRSDQRQIARETLIEARVADANEAWTVQEHLPDWITARTGSAGGYLWYRGNPGGVY